MKCLAILPLIAASAAFAESETITYCKHKFAQVVTDIEVQKFCQFEPDTQRDMQQNLTNTHANCAPVLTDQMRNKVFRLVQRNVRTAVQHKSKPAVCDAVAALYPAQISN